MHPRTEATLANLKNVEWFQNVGVHDTEAAEVVSSWVHAMESCNSPEWEELCLEAANQYREKLIQSSPERFNNWNQIVTKIKPTVKRLVEEKTSKVDQENDLPQSFVDTVEWDILHLCMEAEYADIYPPGFYASQAYWYSKGHFPCGWRGSFPEGTLLIY